ncbi:uroporphyrinogen decarboxylase [Sphingobium sp. CCH11-B1]|jgi:uroporphyrinogen decarboxylase|uniref:uroporphyrinogen decarboxylase n=1 Tax=Sphingobium sp. CCH11-B1 TaxID=1768781 RepID=UPI00083111B6|nr:uroporphyrinogen decarboxylase [Sphingobium sp. CCH11-B1]MEA3389245.1 uroporphyrinogen decarboxylase [Pseudomonadota bacterium]
MRQENRVDPARTALQPKPLMAVLHGEVPAVPPMWLMRQAGRYLPEYRALRAQKGGFLELVYDSEAAAEVTLQPLRRFGFDGAILFSDILIVPYAMGQDLWFEAGEGPRLAPILGDTDLSALTPDFSRFDAVYETVRLVKAALDPAVTFLGFAGSPWTVATYMVAGQGSKDHAAARRMAYSQADRFAALIDAIVDATVTYLSGQIAAGVEAVQLFDSWAGSLAPTQFERWVIEPNRRIVERLKAIHPDVPVIGFPKGAGAKLADYARLTGVDAVGVDETIDPHWANEALPAGMPVQGNLDPLALVAGGRAVEEAVDTIRTAFFGRPHIFNLGHGILPDTPIAHVEALIGHVRQAREPD